jgi:hypothetical protein
MQRKYLLLAHCLKSLINPLNHLNFMKLLLLTVCLFISFLVIAQKNTVPGQMSFYAELGGPGILFSANIDARFTKSQLGFGGRVGIGFVTTDTYYNSNTGYYKTQSVATFPIQLNYIFGKPSSVHSFEAGAGVTFTGKKISIFDYDYDDPSSIYGTACFMYRRQPKDGGFSWRIGFTPIIGNGYIQPSGAVSVGYNF